MSSPESGGEARARLRQTDRGDRSLPTTGTALMTRRWTDLGQPAAPRSARRASHLLDRPATLPIPFRDRRLPGLSARRSSPPARRGERPIARGIRTSISSPWDASSGVRSTSATSCATTSARCSSEDNLPALGAKDRSSSASSPMRPASSAYGRSAVRQAVGDRRSRVHDHPRRPDRDPALTAIWRGISTSSTACSITARSTSPRAQTRICS